VIIRLLEESDTYRIVSRDSEIWLEPVGPWQMSHIMLLESRKIENLRVSYSNECRYEDVSFLKDIAHLRGLHIAQTGSIDLGGLSAVRLLEQLRLHIYGRAHVDLSLFPELRKLDAMWKPRYVHLDHCLQLQELCILSANVRVHDSIGRLPQLKKLSIFGSGRPDLQYLPASMEWLRLTRCAKLRDITRLSSLQNLSELWVQESRTFESLDSLASCTALKSIVLEGVKCIRSVDPLLALPCLSYLQLDTQEPLSSSDVRKLENSTIGQVVLSRKNRLVFERYTST